MIQYPIARDQDGDPVHIDAWERGQTVTCFGCGQDLVGRMPHDGIKPTAHFAHKADAVCNGESALHKAAKAAIVRSHANGSLREISWECPGCKRCSRLTDLRSVTLHVEARRIEGVVSDVLGADASGEPRFAIEVVVTHDMEAQTLERYRLAGLHVFSLQASWGIIGDVVRGLDLLPVDYRLGLVDTSSCEGCQQVLREKEEWVAREAARKRREWGSRWVALWRDIGREMLGRIEEQRHALLRQHANEQHWWKRWSSLWYRIAATIVDSWWIAWREVWRELGVKHSLPYRWQRDWQAFWKEVGRQYAADEAKRVRLIVEENYRENARREKWWPAWIRTWADIGQRASGVMAAWHPICQRCRRDLAMGQVHQCLVTS